MKVKSIEIDNFKLFDSPFTQLTDLNDKDLILLTGPNGYGKTSVFDAVEMALTGKIKRIDAYSGQLGVSKAEAFGNKILIADEKREAYVRLTLVADEREVLLESRYQPKNAKSAKASKENNPWAIFDSFSRTVFMDGKPIAAADEDRVFKDLGIDGLESIIDPFCMISQEENLRFVKMAKTDKAAALDVLFHVPEYLLREQEAAKKAMEILKNAKTKHDVGLLKKLENQGNKLNSDINRLKGQLEAVHMSPGRTAYIRLFPDRDIAWDQQNAILDDSHYREVMSEIDKLNFFSENADSCMNFIFNKPYQELLRPFSGREEPNPQENRLEFAVRYYYLYKQRSEIKEKFLLKRWYEQLKEQLSRRRYAEVDWKKALAEDILDEKTADEIQNRLTTIKVLRETQDAVSSVFTDLSEARAMLMESGRKAMEHSYIETDRCPFCGAKYSRQQELEAHFQAETEQLKAIGGQTAAEIERMVNGIGADYGNDMLMRIDEKLRRIDVSEDLYKKVQRIEAAYDDSGNGVWKLLKPLDIPVPETYETDLAQAQAIYDHLCGMIRSQLKEITADVSDKLKEYQFDVEYRYYYAEREARFRSVTPEMLESKRNYLVELSYTLIARELNKKRRELETVEKRKGKIAGIYEKLERYEKALESGIGSYKKKIVYDIEPLLYVYTSKILQQKFNGKSVFLLFDDEKKTLRLVNSMSDQQDILYNMSSGQLAAAALAFLLCMNRLYAGQYNFPVLLIDDPMQTIDDVNMVGFVDILRFEFGDSQIFISTHETKFELYLMYKFEKANRKKAVFNMKDLMLLNMGSES